MYYGGWVAENIYFMGSSGMVDVEVDGERTLKLGGISGIEQYQDYTKGLYEVQPYSYGDKKSIYHYREFDVQKLLLHSESPDVFLSHEWPQMTTTQQYCHSKQLQYLLKKKKFFAQDVKQGRLGA
jgi:lariat debranching enzyme